jgi:glutaredoxin
VKEFLSRAGYDFTVRDVDEEHAAYKELVVRGVRSVPLTVIGAQQIKGFDPDALQSALDAAERSSRDR